MQGSSARPRRILPAPSLCTDLQHRPEPAPDGAADPARAPSPPTRGADDAEPLDHRELNRDLAVFATDALVGAGLPLWLPDGGVIREELQALAKEIAHADGCQGVFSPVLGKRALFERSGHLAKFSDDMFPPMAVGGDELVLRPANCPHHALAYAARRHSYRELPVRFNELGAMFRAERSGVLSGLSRVRQINLDDTHVFCRPDQVDDEVARALRSALRAQRGARPARRPRAAVAARRRAGLPRHRRGLGGAEEALRRAAGERAGRATSSSSRPPARRRSTAPSSTSRCATGGATRRPSPPCRSTSSCRSASTSPSTPPTARGRTW